MARSLNWR